GLYFTVMPCQRIVFLFDKGSGGAVGKLVHDMLYGDFPTGGDMVFGMPAKIGIVGPCSVFGYQVIIPVSKPTLEGLMWTTADDDDLIGRICLQQIEGMIQVCRR